MTRQEFKALKAQYQDQIMMTTKSIQYKGHLIEVLRYANVSPRNGRESNVMWNANVDGQRLNSYSLFWRKNVISMAKREIDQMEVK